MHIYNKYFRHSIKNNINYVIERAFAYTRNNKCIIKCDSAIRILVVRVLVRHLSPPSLL